MGSTYDVLHSYGFYTKYKYTHFLLFKFAMKMYQTVLCRLSHLILAKSEAYRQSRSSQSDINKGG